MSIPLAMLVAMLTAPSGELVTGFDMTSDYPTLARRMGWQGDVTAELTFDARGRVTACNIIKSSSYPVLDEATCNILKKRARFKTTDPRGPAGTLTTPPIAWRLTH